MQRVLATCALTRRCTKNKLAAMTVFNTSREVPATQGQVFAAFRDPVRLARWWGPAGFTNTFDVCDFQPGGRWVFTMHGPNGGSHPNESIFAEIDAPSRIVVHHTSEPKYTLTIGLEPSAAGTLVTWSQVLESAALAERLRPIIIPANEQNLDRLAAEMSRVS